MRVLGGWFLTIVSLLLLQVQRSLGDDYADSFVKEVLDEHEEHYDPYGYQASDDASDRQKNLYEEEDVRRKVEEEEEELLRRRMAAEEQERLLEQELYDKIQKEREEQFEAELGRMTKEKQKAAKRQKKIDAKIVKQVLRAAKHEDHYGVLGLWNLEMKIPERTIQIPIVKYDLRIPGYTFFHIPSHAIKRAYRDKAKVTHPDKNRDGRANQAFVAVENSASLLMDETRRRQYDTAMQEQRQKRREEITGRILKAVERTTQTGLHSISVVRRILGPFAFPVSVVGVLLI